ncbi:hypothetical protein BE221DRAFT_69795 [Ostreococcus tauri]|uniref:Protein kinase domain-containing protein n=1 Tax=Ostreococcus tauri TaxID=70448 RepID=A0A1Y5IEH0_OSTTA|nr:hypothetical protein BE221DRAFT_69795 [Ostreococcus tauri]
MASPVARASPIARTRANGRHGRRETVARALDPAEADDFEILSRLATVTLRTREAAPASLAWRSGEDGSVESVVSSSSTARDALGDARVNVYAARWAVEPSTPKATANEDRSTVMLKEYAGRMNDCSRMTRWISWWISMEEVPGCCQDGDYRWRAWWGGRSLWTAQEWHGVRMLGEYPRAEQGETSRAMGFWPPVQRVRDQPTKARARYVRRAVEQCLAGVWFAHERGVAHGAIDGSTFLCSTFMDSKADDLEVRLINFGCSSLCTPESVVVDLKALAATLTELIFSAFSSRGTAESTTAEALRRVFVDIHDLDFARIRAYCEEEPDWSDACDFLAESGGEYWELLKELWRAEELMDGYGVTTSAGDLAERAGYLRRGDTRRREASDARHRVGAAGLLAPPFAWRVPLDTSSAPRRAPSVPCASPQPFMAMMNQHDVPPVSRLHRSHHGFLRRLRVEHDVLKIFRHLPSREIPQIPTITSRRTLAVPPRQLRERVIEHPRVVRVRRQHLRVILALLFPSIPAPAQNVRDVRDIVRRVHDLQPRARVDPHPPPRDADAHDERARGRDTDRPRASRHPPAIALG